MLHRPSPSSGTPVYVQLIEQVKHGLLSGALRPGEGLPDVQHVATALVVNPNSVERAYRQLANEGVLERCGAGEAMAREGFRVAPEATFAIQARRSSGRDRYGAELLAAREVQQRFYPADVSAVPGLEYAGASRPAQAVGGDYYDFIPLSETKAAFAIGDVCGKGVPAALLMATLRAALHAQVRQGGRPRDIVQAVNRLVCDSITSNRFATLFYGHVDVAEGMLDYVNAGHLPPLVRRGLASGLAAAPLQIGGPVIGLSATCRYEEGRIALGAGDCLLACTDGITEALDDGGEEWGEERLAALAMAGRQRTPRALIAEIFTAVDRFTGGTQGDDMTLIVLNLTGPSRHAVSA
jgi:sigma-B regulation protein RsbU (phosphoserine phosphatase)